MPIPSTHRRALNDRLSLASRNLISSQHCRETNGRTCLKDDYTPPHCLESTDVLTSAAISWASCDYSGIIETLTELTGGLKFKQSFTSQL
ncbi:hypothetical protein QLX08_005482 [Tetragonisca angustula]|uniref:Uncharacterized protein n=1 Tax=Tetragonisca angustula TaxID=166442 RepID=A0AAW0ZYC3_9HYME